MPVVLFSFLLALVADTPTIEPVVVAPAVVAPAAIAPAVAAQTPPAGGRQRVLVLDLQGVGVDAETTRVVNGVLASVVSESPLIDVATSADLRALVDVSAQQQASGCDASSCLAELAGAFGARYILYGDLGRLDADIIINVSLFDSQASAAVSRASVVVDELSSLRKHLRPQISTLLAPLGGLPVEVKETSPLFVAGASVAGVGTAVALVAGVLTLVAETKAGTADADIAEKKQALSDGAVALGVTGVAALVAVAGAALATVTLVLE